MAALSKRKQRPPETTLITDLLLALITVALHPTAPYHIRAAILLCALLSVLLPFPLLRFLVLALGMGKADLSVELFPFLGVGVFWALFRTSPSSALKKPGLWLTLIAITTAACPAGILSLWALDLLAPPVGKFFHLSIESYYSRLHLAAVSAIALSAVLLIIWAIQTVGSLRATKLTSYLELYLAFGKQIQLLGRKWKC